MILIVTVGSSSLLLDANRPPSTLVGRKYLFRGNTIKSLRSLAAVVVALFELA